MTKQLAEYSEDLFGPLDLLATRVVSYDDTPWEPSDLVVRRMIEERWIAMEEANRRKGGELIDGPNVRANSMFRNSQGVLELSLQRSTYKKYATTRDDPNIPQDQKGQALYVASFIRTASGSLVFGLNESTEFQHKGMLNISAGGVEPADLLVHCCDTPGGITLDGLDALPSDRILDYALGREMHEELGVRGFHIKYREPKYVMRERIATHPTVLSYSQLVVGDNELMFIHKKHVDEIKRAGGKPEFAALEFIPAEISSVKDSLENFPEKYAPRVQLILQHELNNRQFIR